MVCPMLCRALLCVPQVIVCSILDCTSRFKTEALVLTLLAVAAGSTPNKYLTLEEQLPRLLAPFTDVDYCHVLPYSKSQIITSLPFFKMVPQKDPFFDFSKKTDPAPLVYDKKARLESIINRLTPISFMIDFLGTRGTRTGRASSRCVRRLLVAFW